MDLDLIPAARLGDCEVRERVPHGTTKVAIAVPIEVERHRLQVGYTHDVRISASRLAYWAVTFVNPR